MSCDCQSYNGGIGTTPEVVLPRPDWMAEGERQDGVPVDACIAPVVAHLWQHGVVTLSSCCGHNGMLPEYQRPSVVLGEHEADHDRVRALIAMVDDRPFTLLQWRLLDVTPAPVPSRGDQ